MCTFFNDIAKPEIKRQLKKNQSQFSFTTDLWTSNQNIGYMCITVHYIDEYWNLVNLILDFNKLEPPHIGLAIAERFWNVVKDFGVEKSVFSLVTDNASSAVKAADCIENYIKQVLNNEHILIYTFGCAAHVLNLIAGQALSGIREILENIRSTVNLLHRSTLQSNSFRSFAQGADVSITKLHLKMYQQDGIQLITC
jgi:hypothetical protein